MAPDLISLFKSCTGNLVGLNAAQLFEYSSDPGKGKDAERGHKKKKKNGFDIQAGEAEGGNKFTALSENMAACCVMDHGASDGPSGVGPRLERMGTQLSPREEGSHPDG